MARTSKGTEGTTVTYALTDGAGNVLATVHSSSAAQQWAAETGTAVVASKL